MSCVFCEIVAGREPAEIVDSWPDTIAIVPLNPVVPGHLLVLPKVHVSDFTSDPVVSGTTMCRLAQLADAMHYKDANVITSRGPTATQSVYHLHFHLIPRQLDDKLPLPWHSGRHTRKGT